MAETTDIRPFTQEEITVKSIMDEFRNVALKISFFPDPLKAEIIHGIESELNKIRPPQE